MMQRQEHRAPCPFQTRHREFLEQDHGDVPAPLRGRAVQRIGELLHLVAQALPLDGRREDGQPILEPLALPVGLNSLGQIAEVVPEAQPVEIAVVVPDPRPAVDAELVQGAVPRQTDDMAGGRLGRMLVRRAAHVLPAGGVLLVRCLRLSLHLIEDALALVRFKLILMLGERWCAITGRDVDVQRRHPEHLGPQQLIHRDAEALGPVAIHLDGQHARVRAVGRVLFEPLDRVRVALREEIGPDALYLLDGLHFHRGILERELDAIHIPLTRVSLADCIAQRIVRLQSNPRDLGDLHLFAGELDVERRRLLRRVAPSDADLELILATRCTERRSGEKHPANRRQPHARHGSTSC